MPAGQPESSLPQQAAPADDTPLPPLGAGGVTSPNPNGASGQTSGSPPPAGPDLKRGEAGVAGFFRELPVLLLIAFLLALLIKSFLVQAFFIPSESMVPTLQIGDRVLVNKVVYRLHPPRRGDVIVFEDPHGQDEHRNVVSAVWHWVTEGLGVSTSPEKDFIKRVIGLPGDVVEVKAGGGGRCQVFVNGTALNEPYLNPLDPGSCTFGPVRVHRDSLFVMGDNRGNSNDSRYGLGQIPASKVVGRAFIIIWPASRVGFIRST
jgi:signal peptidase I